MKIKDISVKLPQKEDSIENFFSNCINRKKFVEDTKDHYKKHLKKAKHDLARAIAEFNDGCWDWTVIKAYYSIHHAANALLSKNKNQFSKDHSCLVIALKYYNLIEESLFEDLMRINNRFSDALSLDLTFQLRKISQYNVDEWEEITEQDAKLILDISKRFIKFVEEKI